MRLIDADALIEKLEEKMFNSQSMCPVIKITDVMSLIDEQPTVYDPEAVVSEVMEITSRIFDYCEEIDNNLPADERTGYNMLEDINLLREIVRKGGAK
jgi:hypothetical protein